MTRFSGKASRLAWELFKRTGKVNYYLLYKAIGKAVNIIWRIITAYILVFNSRAIKTPITVTVIFVCKIKRTGKINYYLLYKEIENAIEPTLSDYASNEDKEMER